MIWVQEQQLYPPLYEIELIQREILCPPSRVVVEELFPIHQLQSQIEREGRFFAETRAFSLWDLVDLNTWVSWRNVFCILIGMQRDMNCPMDWKWSAYMHLIWCLNFNGPDLDNILHLGKTSGTHDLFTGAWGGSAALSPTRDSNSRMETFTLWWSLDLVTIRDSLTCMDSLSVMKYANTAKRSKASDVSEATMTLVSVLFNILKSSQGMA